jgi:hypothetical protein
VTGRARPEPVRKLGITKKDRIFMKVHNFTFKVMQGEFVPDQPVTEATDMGLMPLWLGFTKVKGKFYIELTGMTSEELDLFERGVTAAIEAARVVVKELDDLANREYDDDDVRIPLRALRSSPPCVIRSIEPLLGLADDIHDDPELLAANDLDPGEGGEIF